MAKNAIARSDPRGLLARGPSELRSPSDWKQSDSDILAHFLQLDGMLRRSKWYSSPSRVTTQGGKTIGAETPDFESFVFAAVYYRQLEMPKDDVFSCAVAQYSRHTTCLIRRDWVQYELSAFKTALDSAAFPPLDPNITLRELFKWFMYGSGLFHKPRNDKMQKRFNQVYDKHATGMLLYALNTAMKISLNSMANVAAVIHQDLGHWLDKHPLPRPDIRWHHALFEIPESYVP